MGRHPLQTVNITLVGFFLPLYYLIWVEVGWASKMRLSSFLSFGLDLLPVQGQLPSPAAGNLTHPRAFFGLSCFRRICALAERPSPGYQLWHQPTDALGPGLFPP